MLFIPGFLISWATFPGVVVHEFAHKKACEWRGIRVHEVNYFSLSGGGHVKHRSPRRFSDMLAISAAPFVINTVLAFILYLIAILVWRGADVVSGIVPVGYTMVAALGLGWLALSIGWHSIPSFVDANNIWSGVTKNWRSSNLALFSIPLVGLFYIGNLLAFFWFDAIYSLGIGALAYGLIVVI